MLSAYVSSKRNWAIAASLVAAMSGSAQAGPFVQTNLVSNISGLATLTDASLANPWGFSHSAGSPFWISDQGTNIATLYAVTGQTNVSKVNIAPNGFVAIPATASGPQGPTGQVNNTNNTSFLVGNGGNGMRASFIFGDLNGNISAWNTGATAFNQASATGAITGLSINTAQTQLYAASTGGGIQAFNSAFGAVSLGSAFTTPTQIATLGLVPFNVKDISGKVYVTYAPSGRPAQIAATGGMGAVAIFDEAGTLQNFFLSNQLASPWGLALAPSQFGQFAGDLLVGNFSFVKSEINAFDPLTGTFVGTIPIDTGIATAGGLWEIGFGIGGNNGDSNTLYFNDGINGEKDGLFAAITFVPEPFTLSIFGAGLAGTAFLRRRRRKKVTPE
jgi:uncharacterized protein (TIGR03118 family)